MKIVILAKNLPPTDCGIGDHSVRLAEALTEKGHEVSVLTSRDVRFEGIRGFFALRKVLSSIEADLILVQWAPHLYNKKGISLLIPLVVVSVMLAGRPIELIAHELWVPVTDGKTFLAQALQKFAMFLLIVSSKRVFVSTEVWRSLLASYFPGTTKKFVFLPVGNNFSTKSETAYEAPTLIRVTIFSPLSSGKDTTTLQLCKKIVDKSYPRLQWLFVGLNPEWAKAKFPLIYQDSNVIFQGYLPEVQIIEHLKRTTLSIAPFVDGISSRRTSVISLLAYGIPVVTTKGKLTDSFFFSYYPVPLVENRPEELAQAVKDLLDERLDQTLLRQTVFEFYQTYFDWSKIASEILAA